MKQLITSRPDISSLIHAAQYLIPLTRSLAFATWHLQPNTCNQIFAIKNLQSDTFSLMLAIKSLQFKIFKLISQNLYFKLYTYSKHVPSSWHYVSNELTFLKRHATSGYALKITFLLL